MSCIAILMTRILSKIGSSRSKIGRITKAVEQSRIGLKKKGRMFQTLLECDISLVWVGGGTSHLKASPLQTIHIVGGGGGGGGGERGTVHYS